MKLKTHQPFGTTYDSNIQHMLDVAEELDKRLADKANFDDYDSEGTQLAIMSSKLKVFLTNLHELLS